MKAVYIGGGHRYVNVQDSVYWEGEYPTSANFLILY